MTIRQAAGVELGVFLGVMIFEERMKTWGESALLGLGGCVVWCGGVCGVGEF